MKPIIICILFSLFLSFSCVASPLKNIKLAIFDNPNTDISNPLLSKDLKTAYLQGIAVAIYAAQKRGVQINKKIFFYGDNLLDIIQEAPNVNKWDPDIIIGLNSSNAILTSRTLFHSPLVLSISASDIHLSNLPDNFYSLGTPDRYIATRLVNFIDKQFPSSNLMMIIGADSKESTDFGNLVAGLFKKKNPHKKIIQNLFLSADMTTMDIAPLTQGYEKNDVILLFALAGTYNSQISLMNKIANYLAPNKLTFLTTVDNWEGRKTLASTQNTSNPYTALRLDTLFINKTSTHYKNFVSDYKKYYGKAPRDAISFITYNTIMSFIIALKKFPPPTGLPTKKAILWSYKRALHQNPNWFRLMRLVVYKIVGSQEIYYTTLPSDVSY